MERLGLQSVGYMGTSPDGNCLFNAVAQGCSGLSAAFIKQHPGSGQERHIQMRMAAAARLQTDEQLQQLVQADHQHRTSSKPHTRAEHKRSPSAPVASLLGTAVQQDKAWVGGFCIKALALAWNVAIVQLDGSTMQVYTKTHGHGGRMWDTEPAIKYPKAHTRRMVGKEAPAEVFDEDTCFIIYNGRDHFWAALRSGPPVTEAHLQAALGNDCIDHAT